MIVEAIATQLQFSHHVVRTNVGDVTHEESLVRPAPAGNCLNWVLGHIVASRSRFLRGLGADPVWTDAECRPYDQHAAPITDPGEARPLSEIWAAYDLTQKRLLGTIRELTLARLAEKVPRDLVVGPVDTVASALVVLGFHDAYHAGQTGVLRRLLGRPPADL